MTAPALDAQFTLTVGQGPAAFTVRATLRLERGVLVLFGPSGAGKTLCLRALVGIETPTSGAIRAGERTLFDAARRIHVPARRRRIGYVPQQNNLFPFCSVRDNVTFGLPRAARRRPPARVVALMDELGVTALADARPDSLSGGERQRVALARALAVEPRLLVLDEPFAAIDADGRDELRRLVRAVVQRHALPTVLVTHDRADALALADRAVRFVRGATAASGPPAQLLDGPLVVLRATPDGPAVPVGDGIVRARLADAVLEGPAAQLGGSGIPAILALTRPVAPGGPPAPAPAGAADSRSAEPTPAPPASAADAEPSLSTEAPPP